MTQHKDDDTNSIVAIDSKKEAANKLQGNKNNSTSNKSPNFEHRINTLKTKHGMDENPNIKAKATNDGVKAGIELLTPIIVCFFIGMGLDNWLDKSPLFLMIFFVLGVITGFWNIYKLTK